jgi:uncharacterized membrane protein
MADEGMVIAVYSTHSEAEDGIKQLQKSGFDMKNLSIVGKDYHTEEHPVGYYNVGNRMRYWGKLGAFWGGMWGLLFGWAFFWVPGIGPLLAAGPLVSTIVAVLEGAAVTGSLSALGAALFSLGIPKDSVLDYETAIKAGKFMVVAHGTVAEVAKAQDIFRTSGAAALALHKR